MRILIYEQNFSKKGASSLKQKIHVFPFIHSMVNVYYTKLVWANASKHSSILMSLLLLVPKKISPKKILIKPGNLNFDPFMLKYKSSPEIGLH